MVADVRTNAADTDLRRFIARLGTGLKGTTALPPPEVNTLRAVPPDTDLVARFSQAARAAGCSVHQPAGAAWVAEVVALLGKAQARSVLVEAQPESALPAERAATLISALAGAGVAAFQTYDDEALFAADAAVTGVHLAVAETGTLVCASSPASARSASLVPPVHVAIVGAAQIVPDLFDAFARLAQDGAGPASASCLTLITGPSKTADIEGVLITGVHGPGQVHIVIVPH